MIANGPQLREELADFLRTRRSRVRPSDVGLLNGPRRRTQGLRREEVALLANIGVTWYTRLEQGAPINVSESVLSNIASALQLTEHERQHMFLLAGHRPNEATVRETEHVSDVLQRVLDALNPNPAIVRGRRFDVLAWNRAAVALWGDYAIMQGNERNSLWRFFMRREECRVIHPKWDEIAPRYVAQFRAVAAKYMDQPCFQSLIEELLSGSAEFRRYWSQHDVTHVEDGFKYLRHPAFGELSLEYTTLAVPDSPDMYVIAYTAKPGSPEEALLRSL